MDTLTRRDMTKQIIEAGIPTAQVDEVLTSAVALATDGTIDPKAAVTAAVAATLSFELHAPVQQEQVRMSEPTGDDWELQLGAALGIETAVLAILTPDALVALPPTAFDLPEHPFTWDGTHVVVTHLVLDEQGNSQVEVEEGELIPWFGSGRPAEHKVTRATLHDLPAGWRVVVQRDDDLLPAIQFVQDSSYRLGSAASA